MRGFSKALATAAALATASIALAQDETDGLGDLSGLLGGGVVGLVIVGILLFVGFRFFFGGGGDD